MNTPHTRQHQRVGHAHAQLKQRVRDLEDESRMQLADIDVLRNEVKSLRSTVHVAQACCKTFADALASKQSAMDTRTDAEKLRDAVLDRVCSAAWWLLKHVIAPAAAVYAGMIGAGLTLAAIGM